MENRENGLEQIRKEASSRQAEEVRTLLDQGKYIQAEALARSANLSPKDWTQVDDEADNAIRGLSEGPLPEGPIPAERAEEVVTGAEDGEIFKYGKANMPGMEDIAELEKSVTESDQILDEILKLISEAKKNTTKNMWAKPVGIIALPIIADIYALIKGNKLRKQLKKLEELNEKLTNPKFLNVGLKADKISPNMGHKLTLAGLGTAVAGGAVAVAASNPVGLGIGVGMYVAGGVTALAGTIKQVIDFVNMGGTSQSLRDLENRLINVKEQNDSTRNQINTVKNWYIQGARKNLQPIMA